ncbi:hypothetical protein [Mesohalobacter salilacus]|uniref:hypothetical protein n=1 Tax=Mesohalobacter salilacus TaxID=2491711 RepID=UPI0026795EE1
MKITDELKKRKIPIVSIDKRLNEFDERIQFPEKQDKANKMLKSTGLPKQWMTEHYS